MKIILSEECESITGSLGRGYGYYIRRIGKRFFGQRSKHYVPADGHIRFIFICAEMALQKLYLTDIRVQAKELREALEEAHHFVAAGNVRDRKVYDARDIRNFKITFGL